MEATNNNNNNQNQLRRQLSQQELDIFDEFDLQQKKDSKYIRFKDGETKTLKFDTTKKPEREESKRYAGKINWKFSVVEPSVNLDQKDWCKSCKSRSRRAKKRLYCTRYREIWFWNRY